jgi:hypothetical protein
VTTIFLPQSIRISQRIVLPTINSLEFEGIKTRVVDALPDSKEEGGAFVLEPLFNEGSSSIEVPHHVSE